MIEPEFLSWEDVCRLHSTSLELFCDELRCGSKEALGGAEGRGVMEGLNSDERAIGVVK
jgi:hypothetical protein